MAITLVLAVIVGVVAFFGGMKYQQTQAGANVNGGQYTNGINRQGGQRQGRFANGGTAVGEIISQDDKSITIKLPDGSSKIIILSASTTYTKSDTASKSDLKTGERVAAFGNPNSDGSITAQNIQLNPLFRMDQGRQTSQPQPTQ